MWHRKLGSGYDPWRLPSNEESGAGRNGKLMQGTGANVKGPGRKKWDSCEGWMEIRKIRDKERHV